ncbi:LysR family transcriptional regulator [Azohydromonas caseinilytica]|uniref:LysR family transcriptional regulator n=1 Tax=Azohydromonas caseinilytica TaxID=2728836 RepID=A0A848FCI4_9BURK|nr:LysR family transcriptional regulator [Azohydromonas caseinilytica]NML17184.1 LysR family transcriptional regulator [Azohydromonas caseinilytica]
MVRFEDLNLFVRAAALGSFSSAAREADLLPAQVSAAVKRLEKALGACLFARSTRSLRLTAQGEQYLPFARNALDALRQGGELVQHEPSEVRGVLQVAVSSDLGRNVLLPVLSAFRRAHPALSLRLFLSDQVADVFRDPVDVALRYGAIEEASFVALPLAPENRRMLAASPEYLARRGRPGSVQELLRHDCLLYLRAGRVYDQWGFATGGRRCEVRVSGPLLSDDADVVRRWALAGEGIAYKSWLDLRADVQAGRLELLLPGVWGDLVPLQLVCPHRRQFSPAVRQLHAALKAHCEALMADMPRPAQ